MWELNTLAIRYYLEDVERAARHDIAEQKHRERTGSFQTLFSGLMQAVAGAFSPFAPKSPGHSE